MTKHDFDVIVIGGGPAGMAAALGSAKNGSRTLLIERNHTLGGILNQCIHNGFGLHYFGEELTGPEFAARFEKLVKKDKNIAVLTDTFVTEIKPNEVTITNKNGIQNITAGAIVLATGARERTPAAIRLNGTRPQGIMTAGVAQKMVNILGYLPGKKVVILGSGDIGLIMARRLTLEGAKVLAVLEINSTTSGLRRNVLQCVEDYNIPLLFNTTVFEVVGKDRVEGIYYGQVDEHFAPIENTRKFLKCDTLVLSVGLTPETDLLPNLELKKVTNGALVDEFYQTNIKSIFSAGNVLHIHDLVDNVAIEAESAGKCASDYAKGILKTTNPISVEAGNGLTYVLPNIAYHTENKLVAKFRLKNKITKSFIIAKSGDQILSKKYMLAGVPGEMITMEIDKANAKDNIVVEVQS